jgi:hypothetical protein
MPSKDNVEPNLAKLRSARDAPMSVKSKSDIELPKRAMLRIASEDPM